MDRSDALKLSCYPRETGAGSVGYFPNLFSGKQCPKPKRVKHLDRTTVTKLNNQTTPFTGDPDETVKSTHQSHYAAPTETAP
jgi:hypothetical protein